MFCHCIRYKASGVNQVIFNWVGLLGVVVIIKCNKKRPGGESSVQLKQDCYYSFTLQKVGSRSTPQNIQHVIKSIKFDKVSR